MLRTNKEKQVAYCEARRHGRLEQRGLIIPGPNSVTEQSIQCDPIHHSPKSTYLSNLPLQSGCLPLQSLVTLELPTMYCSRQLGSILPLGPYYNCAVPTPTFSTPSLFDPTRSILHHPRESIYLCPTLSMTRAYNTFKPQPKSNLGHRLFTLRLC